ncbi:MAG: 3-dehydroquinate synthase [Candidatus Omnitrophica bacterium]|nr:3-dehydroquinate synthase [Candidatus Omnitrophota bacterium]
MKKINVNLDTCTYPITIGTGIMRNLPAIVPADLLSNPILIVTNKHIRSLIGDRLAGVLKNKKKNVAVLDIPDSERAKSFAVYQKIIVSLAEIGQRAKPTLIALGGGVIGDVAGFAAATYRRGIPYIQVPTTFLAQVDSSIGGKVAIDLPQAKNLVGTFYQPSAVVTDLAVLKTLPPRQIRNGLGEVIKYGIIHDAQFFEYVSSHIDAILRCDSVSMEHAVWTCAAIKADIVSCDEFDVTGVRAVLNFGHTFGHAIEAASGYSKGFTHGEAVGAGMVMASDLALRLGMITSVEFDRICSVIHRAGLPTEVASKMSRGILEALEYDKKFIGGQMRFVLPIRIGAVKIVDRIPYKTIKDVVIRGGV